MTLYALLLVVAPAAYAIEAGQVDDFEDSGVANWRKGVPSSNPPTNINSGGPSGADDNYLESVSTGGVGADSRQVIFNNVQWTGSYSGAGVEQVRMHVRNSGSNPLNIRIALQSGTTWFAATEAAALSTGSGWQIATFDLSGATMTRVQGTMTLDAVLANVVEMRILSSVTPDFRGDVGATTMDLDNIEAVGEPDSDGDGVPDSEDAFPNDPNESQDTDGDGVGDNGDAFPNDPAEDTDTDGDGTGNNADTDDDNDGLADAQDAWPLGRFADVDPASHFAFLFVETLERSGVTGGCGGDDYCPEDPVTRAQMAVFLERGMRGSDFVPPAAAGNVFLDVAANDFAAAFIEQLFADGITGGCGSNNYCPEDNVTRSQMAVFLLRAKFGSGYSPPPAVGVFADAPLGSFAVDWIEALAAEGITGGCGGGNYCPADPITRGQMAVFLVRAFGL